MRSGGIGDAIPLHGFQEAPSFKAGSFTWGLTLQPRSIYDQMPDAEKLLDYALLGAYTVTESP